MGTNSVPKYGLFYLVICNFLLLSSSHSDPTTALITTSTALISSTVNYDIPNNEVGNWFCRAKKGLSDRRNELNKPEEVEKEISDVYKRMDDLERRISSLVNINAAILRVIAAL